MHVAVLQGKLIFTAQSNSEAVKVVRKDLVSGFETDITAKAAITCDSADGQLTVALGLEDVNAAKETVVIRSEQESLDFTPALARFVLDPSQIDSHRYMTIAIFGAGQRSLKGEELLYLLLCHLDSIPLDNQFYGGLLTVASFRVAEDLGSRSFLLDKILKKYWVFVEKTKLLANHSIRWYISSSVNVAILSLYCDKEAHAEKIIETAVSRSIPNGMFPLTYMNYCNLLALGGMFALNRGDRDLAFLRFGECANSCSLAVADLFSPRNNYYFQHEFDVKTLVNLGYQAAIAMAALSGNSHPGDSKLAMSVSAAPIDRAGFTMVFGRFQSELKRLPAIAQRVEKLLRTRGA